MSDTTCPDLRRGTYLTFRFISPSFWSFPSLLVPLFSFEVFVLNLNYRNFSILLYTVSIFVLRNFSSLISCLSRCFNFYTTSITLWLIFPILLSTFFSRSLSLFFCFFTFYLLYYSFNFLVRSTRF